MHSTAKYSISDCVTGSDRTGKRGWECNMVRAIEVGRLVEHGG